MFRYFRHLMGIQICLLTWWKGRLVGRDQDGNRYYEEKKPTGTQRRWVLYRGMAEASKVPAAWHGWLHHTTHTPPNDNLCNQVDCETDSQKQKEYENHKEHKDGVEIPFSNQHRPNLTGTVLAYHPKGHSTYGKNSPLNIHNTTQHYEPWDPTVA